MYLCGVCEKTIGPRVKRTLVVVEQRARVYYYKQSYPTKGIETAKEIAVCPDCKKKLQTVVLLPDSSSSSSEEVVVM